jgi:leucyl/phenylalanyl-tRNA--protein transferase
LARHLEKQGYALLDCQVPNPHLLSMGACLIARTEFFECLLAGGLGAGGTAEKVLFPEVL